MHELLSSVRQGSDLENTGQIQGFRVNNTPCALAVTVYAMNTMSKL